MEFGAIKAAPEITSGQVAKSPVQERLPGQPQDGVGGESKTQSVLQQQASAVQATQQTEQKKIQPDETRKAIAAVNKFLDYMTADLRFKYNEKVNIMQVQLVSEQNQKVLREYPPKEFLEMVANIREAIGMFLDKKV